MRNKIKKNRFSLSEEESRDHGEENASSSRSPQRRMHLIHIALASGIFIVSITLVILFITLYRKPDLTNGKPGSVIGELLPQDENGLDDSEAEQATSEELSRAIRAYTEGRYPSARAILSEIVESDASDSDKSTALVYLGRIELAHDNTSRAISSFERAVKFNRNNHIAHIELAKAFADSGDFDSALTHIDRAIEIDDSDTDAHLVRGNLLFRQQKYQAASESYGRAIELDGENGHAYYNRALAHIKLGDRFAAIEDLKRAAATGSSRIAQLSYSRLGTLFIQNRDYDSAIRYLNLAVSGGDGAAIDLFNLGLAHLSTGERDKAIEFFQKAEAKGSEDMELISRLADVYTSSYNNYNKGIELYSQLAEKRSGNTEILLKLGELYYQNNDYNSALVYFRRVSEMEGASHNAKRAYMYLGTIYDENQRYEDALDAYRSAIEIDPTDAAAFYNMGIAYRNMGDTVNAVENWKKAYQLNPDNPRPLIATADLLYENDYLDEAAAEYVNIVEKWPSNSSALFSLATIYNRKENRASARKYYNKVIELDADRELVKKSLINLALLSVEEEDTQATAEQLSESVAMIKKALMISPGDNEALYALGVIYYKKELYERAVETFYQVIKAEKHPEEIAKAYNNIGKAYFQMGEYRKAVRAFSLGIEEDPSNEEIRINRRSASQKYEQEIGAAAN